MGGYVRVLGPLAVEGSNASGAGSSSPGRTQRRVLAMLCAEPGSVVSLDRLREGLAVSSNASVRSAVSRVRALLGDAVRQEAPGYLIDATAVDSQRFVDLTTEARLAEPAAAIGLFDAALSLWRGSAFEEFADEEWVAAAAIWLDEARITAREDRVEALIGVAQFSTAASDAEKLAAEHPLRERPRSLLMRSMALDGRRTEALRVFNNFSRFLAEEVAVEPSSELRSLEQTIATGQLTSAAGPPTSTTYQRDWTDNDPADSSATGLPSGVVTFLLTDVEGSTRLWDSDRDAMSASLSVHDSVVQETIESNGGYVFTKAGDSFAAAFTRASEAVHAAAQAQAALQAAEWPGPALAVRIGLHLGEAEERNGDYFGPVVNTAARVEAAAHGGQVLLTEAVCQAAATDARFLGQHRLKDLQQPLRLFQLGEQEFPPLRAIDERLTNLPVAANELLGRENELALMTATLDEDRLVTLTGVGGVGKTRLAQAAAFGRIGIHLDGVWSVELAKCSDSDTVLSAVVKALGAMASTSIEELVELVRGQDVLMVLDNCEHVLDEIYDLSEALLRGCPRLRILATSREGIGLADERVVVVRSLAPDGARSLFLERVHQTGSAVDTESARNAEAVTEICQRLDGIPLALELAAATTRVLSPREIADRLDERFVLLRGSGRRRGVERHQTLRAAVDWSYDSLTEPQQRFFRQLGVFVGGISIPAAESLAADLDDEAITLLTDLVERSLLVPKHGEGDVRYELLETLRQYALDRLVDHNELAAATEAHARWCRDYAAVHAPSLAGPDEIATIWRLHAETANFRVAVDWALETANSDLAIEILISLVDVVLSDAGLAELCRPITANGIPNPHPYRDELLYLETIRRGGARQSGDNRNRLMAEIFETLDPVSTGLNAMLWGQAASIVARSDAAVTERLFELGRTHPDALQRTYYLSGALLSAIVTTDLEVLGSSIAELNDTAVAAGAKRYLVIGGLVTGMRIAHGDEPSRLLELSEPGLAVLPLLPRGSFGANILLSHYTDAAIRAGLSPDRLFDGLRHLGPVLRGDYDRIALGMVRLVEHFGDPALAVRGLGAVVASGRSPTSGLLRATTLAAAAKSLGATEVEELLRLGATQDRNDLYREMWAFLEPHMAKAS